MTIFSSFVIHSKVKDLMKMTQNLSEEDPRSFFLPVQKKIHGQGQKNVGQNLFSVFLFWLSCSICIASRKSQPRLAESTDLPVCQVLLQFFRAFERLISNDVKFLFKYRLKVKLKSWFLFRSSASCCRHDWMLELIWNSEGKNLATLGRSIYST